MGLDFKIRFSEPNDVEEEKTKNYLFSLIRDLYSFVTGLNNSINQQIKTEIVSTDSSLTLAPVNQIVVVDSVSTAVTLTLPEASTAKGKTITVKKKNSSGNNITIEGAGSETIDGNASYVISSTNKASVMMTSNGVEWLVLNFTS